MSAWDAAINIGVKVFTSFLDDKGKSKSTPAKKKVFDTSKYQTNKDFSGLSATQKRRADKTNRAQTVREKNEEKVSQKDDGGADSLELAKMWNEVFGNEAR